MSAVLASLVASLAWGIADFGGGRAARGRHVVAVLAITRPAGLLVLAPLALLLPTSPLGDGWPYAVAAGGVLPLAILCLYRALAIGPMPVVAPLFTLSAAVPVLAGLLAGETPGPVVAVGLLLAATGAVLAARSPMPAPGPAEPAGAGVATGDAGTGPVGGVDGGAGRARSGVAYALGAALLIGVGLVALDAAAARDPLRAVLVARTVETLLVTALALVLVRRVAADLRPVWPIPVIGALEGTAILAFSLATDGGLLPVVAVLSSLYPVVTMLLAWRLLHERTAGLQLAGAALTLVGVGVVAAGGAA